MIMAQKTKKSRSDRMILSPNLSPFRPLIDRDNKELAKTVLQTHVDHIRHTRELAEAIIGYGHWEPEMSIMAQATKLPERAITDAIKAADVTDEKVRLNLAIIEKESASLTVQLLAGAALGNQMQEREKVKNMNYWEY